MEFIESIIMGIVQGLTEFLPVSSSGHLAIAQHVFGITDNNLFLNVMLHIGTLVAVCIFYRKLILRLIVAFFKMVGDIFTGRFKWSKMDDDRNLVMMIIIGLLPLFLLFLPVPFVRGMKIKDLADELSAGHLPIVGVSLLITSMLLFIGMVFNAKTKRREMRLGMYNPSLGAGRRRLNFMDAVVIGLTQCIAAVFPGISRSGSTLATGEVAGLNKQTALDYTFVLGIPSILAAAVLETKDAVTAGLGDVNILAVIVGMVVSAVVGYFSISLFKWLLKTDKTYVFVIYTAVIGLLAVIVSIIEKCMGVSNLFGA